MKSWLYNSLLALLILPSPLLAGSEAGVKTYLLQTLGTMERASIDLASNAHQYKNLTQKYISPSARFSPADDRLLHTLIAQMQENYKKIDSFGYETIEGIVAGVPLLEPFDTLLDAGVPQAEGPENIAPVTLHLSNGETINREGSLFTHLLEPMLWGGNPKWCHPRDLNGDGKIEPRESIPKGEVLEAVAQEILIQIQNLKKTSEQWTPTSDDLFGAMSKMTPTLSEYFEDWKESRYRTYDSGKFAAVSRISDMKGIMKSCQIMFISVQLSVEKKDPALVKMIRSGFASIFDFLKKIEKEETAHQKFTEAQIDELAAQAKRYTDSLVPQIEQAWSLTKTDPPETEALKRP